METIINFTIASSMVLFLVLVIAGIFVFTTPSEEREGTLYEILSTLFNRIMENIS